MIRFRTFILVGVIVIVSMGLSGSLYAMEGIKSPFEKKGEIAAKKDAPGETFPSNVNTRLQKNPERNHTRDGFMHSGNCGALVMVTVLTAAVLMHTFGDQLGDQLTQFLLSYY